MKRICILLTGILLSLGSFAQIDSTANQSDTIRVGGMIIIKKKGDHSQDVNIQKRKDQNHSKISTNWWIIDIGFANYTDNTNYAAAQASGFLANNVGADQLDLRNGKSVDVNLWIFMQRLNLIKNVVNLKYGLGVELNNYRYKSPVKYETSPTHIILDQSTSYKKNKLAADYITVPLMLNFNLTPDRKRGFGFSAGVSAGYLYSSRQKTITDANGKHKEHDDFDLRKWKLSYIAELQLGPVKLYGSLASQSMFEKGLDQTPYNFGLRLSNW